MGGWLGLLPVDDMEPGLEGGAARGAGPRGAATGGDGVQGYVGHSWLSISSISSMWSAQLKPWGTTTGKNDFSALIGEVGSLPSISRGNGLRGFPCTAYLRLGIFEN